MNWVKMWDEFPPVAREVWLTNHHTHEVWRGNFILGVDREPYWHVQGVSSLVVNPTHWCLVDTSTTPVTTDAPDLGVAAQNFQSICTKQGKLISEFEGLVEQYDKALVQLEKLTDKLVVKRGKSSVDTQ